MEPRPLLLPSPPASSPRQALGWLAMLMPTQEATRREGDWGAWAPAWVALWPRVAHSSHYWSALWYALFARLAKHDVHGAGVAGGGVGDGGGVGLT